MIRPLRRRAAAALLAACLTAPAAAQGLVEVAPAAQAQPPKPDSDKPSAEAPTLYAEFLRTDDLDLAAGAARRLILDGMEPQVLRTPSGALAVVAGPTPIADPQSETLRLKEERSPIPIRYAPPSEYGAPVVWRRPAEVLAGADYRRGEPARLTYGDLVVEVTQRQGPTGRPAPVAIGRVGGAVVFSTPPREDAERAPFGQVRLIRLDPAARHPAVVLTAYTGGMHCCTVTTIAAEQGDGRWSVAQGCGSTPTATNSRMSTATGRSAAVARQQLSLRLHLLCRLLRAAAPVAAGGRPARRRDAAARDARLPAPERAGAGVRPHARAMARERLSGGMGGDQVPARRRPRRLGGDGALHQEFSMMTPEVCPDGSLDGCPQARKRRVPFKEAFAAHLRANGYPLDPPQRAAGGAVALAPGVAATSLPGLAACSALTLWPHDGPPSPAFVAGQAGGLTLLRAPTLKAAPAALGAATGDKKTGSEAIWLAARPDAPARAVRGPLAGPREGGDGAVLVGGPILDRRGGLVALMGQQGEAIPLGPALAALGAARRPPGAAVVAPRALGAAGGDGRDGRMRAVSDPPRVARRALRPCSARSRSSRPSCWPPRRRRRARRRLRRPRRRGPSAWPCCATRRFRPPSAP
ncbi:MAG: hypothetical protein HZY79_05000 [Rhodoblastus sp.]|nr:MAG: hypothetical protein HZY79_05000 [Rhodoblastus sp.]